MAKYIDPDLLRKEIEKRLKNVRDYMSGTGMRCKGPKYFKAQGKESAYDALLSIVNSLQQEQEKPVPNDLEEAAKEYAYDGDIDGYGVTYAESNGKYFRAEVMNHFIAGAKWQKEQDEKELSEKIAGAYQLGLSDKEKQMMKEAVEGEVVQDLKGVNRVKSFSKIPEWLYFGDKVKLIIVKENTK